MRRYHVPVVTTVRGLAVWEQGGRQSWMGSVRIVADAQGQSKEPLAIPQRPRKAREQGLFLVAPGDLIVECERYFRAPFREMTALRVLQLRELTEQGALCRLVYHAAGVGLPEDIPERYAAVVHAAYEKAGCHGCVHVHYRRDGGVP